MVTPSIWGGWRCQTTAVTPAVSLDGMRAKATAACYMMTVDTDTAQPTLMRHGYSAKVLTEMLGTKPAEMRALFRQSLEPDRARELKEQLLSAGMPV